MGLHTENNYLQAFANPQYSTKLTDALRTCCDELSGGGAGPALVRWFGEDTPELRAHLKDRLNRLRGVITNTTVVVSFIPLTERDMGMNAGAAPGLRIDDNPLATERHGIEYRGVFAAVFFNEGFFRGLSDQLPLAGGLIDSTAYNQSKFETIVHELSHYFFNTNDESINGNTAYGAQRAEALAAANPALALTNAENWGIFVEAVGVHQTS